MGGSWSVIQSLSDRDKVMKWCMTGMNEGECLGLSLRLYEGFGVEFFVIKPTTCVA